MSTTWGSMQARYPDGAIKRVVKRGPLDYWKSTPTLPPTQEGK